MGTTRWVLLIGHQVWPGHAWQVEHVQLPAQCSMGLGEGGATQGPAHNQGTVCATAAVCFRPCLVETVTMLDVAVHAARCHLLSLC